MSDPRIEAAAKALYEREGRVERWEDAHKENPALPEEYYGDAIAALAAADRAETITTLAQLGALPDGSAFIDTAGDIGIVQCGYVHYPETDSLGLDYVAKRYLPARVIHWGTE
ncbi:hypothetical protein BLJ79_21450 [Arthrobacter sp. UCD-GKA]|uniref:hypothetical protein n=1 Tax=Arthrobacter sp. UCD-GKA TaxID=1913576 RepID=UPI0008DE762E|nr:hypothetical protein [Arthrobacter sp. UCD-GKA]OIH81929.1 hypothetical protein BLJ79_21450 [Arthrobacter sp. UCD-GKA]